jgi:hypothetical protein
MNAALFILETIALLACLIGYTLTRGSSFADLFFVLAALIIPYSLLRIVSSPKRGAEYSTFRFLVIMALVVIMLLAMDGAILFTTSRYMDV